MKLIKHYRGAGCPRYNFAFVRLSLSCISQVGGCACVVTEHRIHRTSRFHPWLPGYSLSSCFVWRARYNDLTCCLKVYTSLPKEVLYVPVEHLKYVFYPVLREIVFIVFSNSLLRIMWREIKMDMLVCCYTNICYIVYPSIADVRMTSNTLLFSVTDIFSIFFT